MSGYESDKDSFDDDKLKSLITEPSQRTGYLSENSLVLGVINGHPRRLSATICITLVCIVFVFLNNEQ